MGKIGGIFVYSAFPLDRLHENAGGLVVDRRDESVEIARLHLNESWHIRGKALADGGVARGRDHR